MTKTSALNKIKELSSGLFLVLVVLIPIFFLPFFTNMVGSAKLLLLFFATLVTVIFYSLQILKQKKWEMLVSPFTLLLVGMGIVAIVSSFLTSSYPMKSFLGWGGIFVAISLIGVVGPSLVKKDRINQLVSALGIGGAVLSVFTFLQTMGWGPSRVINYFFPYNIPNTSLFNLSGSPFLSTQIFVLALIGVISTVVVKKNLSRLNSIVIPALVVGLAISTWSLLPGKETSVTLPPFTSSWMIALDSIRQPRAALFGSGPESYSNVYSILKPNFVNNESYWQFRFSSGSNFPLTIVVTMGFVGLLIWLLMAIRVFLDAKKELKEKSPTTLPIHLVLVATFVMQLLFPTNLIVTVVQIVFLVFWVAAKKSQYHVLQIRSLPAAFYPYSGETSSRSKMGIGLIMSVVIILLATPFAFYQITKAYASDYYMNKANISAIENNIVDVFENQRKAVQLNPYIDYVRRQFALTNLQIAVALSNNTELSPEERSQIVQLSNQAVTEARASTVIDPANSQNWVALTEVYKKLRGTTEEAHQWAVDSLVEAIKKDPTNPILRVDLGNIFFDKEQYQDAANFFNQAIDLKPDHPAGYYHIGRALVKLEKFPQAQQAWTQALTLLEADSDDYITISKELETIKPEVEKALEEQKKLQEAQAKQQAGQSQQQAEQSQQQAGQAQQGSAQQNQPSALNQINNEPLPSSPKNKPSLTEQNIKQSDKDVVSSPPPPIFKPY